VLQSPRNAHASIDVVIPLRNGAKTILAALATIDAQSLQPRRIIVVDNGSDDGGAALIQDHPRVDLIRTPPLGVGHARNTGIRASNAEYIAFLDCDDLWRADKLERQWEIAARNLDVAVVLCGQVHTRMNGEAIALTGKVPRYRGHAFERVLADCFNHGGWSSNLFVRRDALLECGGFDDGIAVGEDVDLCLRLARNHPFDSCAERLVFIRENPASLTRKVSSPDWHMGAAVQLLAAVDRWTVGRSALSPVYRQCAHVILTRFARGPLRLGRLKAFRHTLAQGAPNIAAKIARNDLAFARNLALYSMLLVPKLFLAGLRYGAKRSRSFVRPQRSEEPAETMPAPRVAEDSAVP
jgi:glycosyltransferase involved in cell wall biosynthesis